MIETWTEMCHRILTEEELEQNPHILKIYGNSNNNTVGDSSN